MAVCGLHGLLFGTLYAPAQALMYGLSFKAMLAWIVAGLPYDVTHMIGNICAGALVVPVSTVLLRLERRAQQR
jgi:energy-coupling factor transport system substrate-specific component